MRTGAWQEIDLSSPRWWQSLGVEVPDSFSHGQWMPFQWLSPSSGLATRKELEKYHLSLKEGEFKESYFFPSYMDVHLLFLSQGFTDKLHGFRGLSLTLISCFDRIRCREFCVKWVRSLQGDYVGCCSWPYRVYDPSIQYMDLLLSREMGRLEPRRRSYHPSFIPRHPVSPIMYQALWNPVEAVGAFCYYSRTSFLGDRPQAYVFRLVKAHKSAVRAKT